MSKATASTKDTKPLPMDNGEIYRSYKDAKNKKEQMMILAELNATTIERIREILLAQGVPPQSLPRNRKKKSEAQAPSVPFSLQPASEAATAHVAPVFIVPESVKDAVRGHLTELDRRIAARQKDVEKAENTLREAKDKLKADYETVAELEAFLSSVADRGEGEPDDAA